MATNQSLFLATQKASQSQNWKKNTQNPVQPPSVPSWMQNILTPQLPVAKTQNPLLPTLNQTMAPSMPSWMQNILVPQVPVAKTQNPLLTMQPATSNPPTRTTGYPGVPGKTPTLITNPTPPPDKGENQDYNLGKDSQPFKDWYSYVNPTTGKKNSDYFDNLSPEEQAALIDTVNQAGKTTVPGWNDSVLQDSADQYFQMQTEAANAAYNAAQAAKQYYVPTKTLPDNSSPFSSSYGWGSGGGGGGYSSYVPNWLSNLTNWNIS
jgi:hypothetical protein